MGSVKQICPGNRSRRQSSRTRKPNKRYPQLVFDNSVVIECDTQEEYDTQEDPVFVPDTQEECDTQEDPDFVPDTQENPIRSNKLEISVVVPETQDSQAETDQSMLLSPHVENSVSDNSVSDSQTQISPLQTDTVGFHTLVSETFIDNIPQTPLSTRYERTVRDLVQANAKTTELQRTVETLSEKLLASSVHLENEKLLVTELRNQLQSHKCPKPKTPVSHMAKADELQKNLKVTEAKVVELKLENTDLKNLLEAADIEKLKETIAALEDNLKKVKCDTKKPEVVYFRGWWNPLSAFHDTPVTYNSRRFRTVEHCYQYEKATFHQKSLAARDILNAKLPGLAKTIAKRAIPTPSPTWEDVSGTVMLDILKRKVECSPFFREKLLATKDKTLIHNMESDSKWGFGPDGNGKNLMGKVLMRVRAWAVQNPANPTNPAKPANPASPANPANPANPASPHTETQSHEHKTRPLMSAVVCGAKQSDCPDIMLIGNSNIRGLASELNCLGVNATGFVFSGCSSTIIKSKISMSKPKEKPPSFVFLHTGDIDARTDLPVSPTLDAVREAIRIFPDSRIIVNSPSTKVKDQAVAQRLTNLHKHLEGISRAHNNVTVMNSMDLPLRDGIHWTVKSRKLLASNIVTRVGWSPQCL